MSEKIQEQISAFLDDELPANEAELLVHRLSRDPAMHRKAMTYRTIGAAVRGELLSPNPDLLRQRILKALDGEPAVAELPTPARWDHGRLTRPAIGLAVAAAVAMVAILGLRNMVQQGSGSGSTPLVAGVADPAPRSYVVPREPTDASLVRVPIRLTNYLVHHGEYASSLGRKSIHSDIVGYRSNVDSDEEVSARDSR